MNQSNGLVENEPEAQLFAVVAQKDFALEWLSWSLRFDGCRHICQVFLNPKPRFVTLRFRFADDRFASVNWQRVIAVGNSVPIAVGISGVGKDIFCPCVDLRRPDKHFPNPSEHQNFVQIAQAIAVGVLQVWAAVETLFVQRNRWAIIGDTIFVGIIGNRYLPELVGKPQTQIAAMPMPQNPSVAVVMLAKIVGKAIRRDGEVVEGIFGVTTFSELTVKLVVELVNE